MLESFFVSAAQTAMNNGPRFEKDGGHGFEKDGGHGFEKDGEHQFEGFTSYGPAMGTGGDLAGMIGRVLALLFVLLLISFFGQYFWNNYVTSLFTIAKPAKSVMQILGLFIFVRLMFP